MLCCKDSHLIVRNTKTIKNNFFTVYIFKKLISTDKKQRKATL